MDPQKSETAHMRQLIEEQPRAMLRDSIKNAMETLKRIQSEVQQDQEFIDQTIESLEMRDLGAEELQFRNATEPDSSPKQSAKDVMPTFGSEVGSTGCDEEVKFNVTPPFHPLGGGGYGFDRGGG